MGSARWSSTGSSSPRSVSLPLLLTHRPSFNRREWLTLLFCVLPRSPAPVPLPVPRPRAHHRLARLAHGRNHACDARRRRHPLRPRAPGHHSAGSPSPSPPSEPRSSPSAERTTPPTPTAPRSPATSRRPLPLHRALLGPAQQAPDQRHSAIVVTAYGTLLRHRDAPASASLRSTACRQSTTSPSRPGSRSPPAACSAPPPPRCSGTGE